MSWPGVYRPGPSWRRDADVVVVGSGAAGISAALTAAGAGPGSGASVLVITKDLTGGASPLAQGGLAAAIGPGDTAAAHARDTEIAGVGLCEPEVVAALAAGSPGAVQWLVTVGAKLERRALRLEGGHSANRVVHSGNDASGAEVHRALLEALLTSGIEVLDRTIALDLTLDGTGSVTGLTAASIGPGGALSPGLITARAVILAAGGLGQAYATTTNPAGATGDALAIAARAGAVLRDPEFVQFHPTVLHPPGAAGPGRSVGAGREAGRGRLAGEILSGGQLPLITEALRGAGAVLRDLHGRPLMAGHDPRGDLAPRDIVAARVHSAIASASGDGAFGDGVSGGGPGHVWLDATALGADVLENGFPTVTAACRKHDIDPVTDLIPVAPGAHYSCGGILAGLDGRTSVPGLYAIGEAASTGVHGANRLASNSLVEAVIAGRRTGTTATGAPIAPVASTATVPQRMDGPFIRSEAYEWAIHLPAPWAGAGAPGAAREARAALASAMSRYAGVLRDAPGLERLLRIATPLPNGAPGPAGAPGSNGAPLGLGDVEAANLREASALIAAAALRRAESRGAHRRSDATATETRARHTLVRYKSTYCKSAPYENAHPDSARYNSAREGGAHENSARCESARPDSAHGGRIYLDWEDL